MNPRWYHDTLYDNEQPRRPSDTVCSESPSLDDHHAQQLRVLFLSLVQITYSHSWEHLGSSYKSLEDHTLACDDPSRHRIVLGMLFQLGFEAPPPSDRRRTRLLRYHWQSRIRVPEFATEWHDVDVVQESRFRLPITASWRPIPLLHLRYWNPNRTTNLHHS